MAKLRSSRARPWPYDLIVDTSNGDGGVGMMLNSQGENGPIFEGTRARPLEANPTTYEYGSTSPYLERTYPFTDLVLGMGQRVQEDNRPRRYDHGINFDGSINGRWMKGPKLNTQTVFASNPVTAFCRANYNGTDALWCGVGDELHVRTTDHATTGWFRVYDFGSSRTVRQMVRFRGTSGNEYVCVSVVTSGGTGGFFAFRTDLPFTDGSFAFDGPTAFGGDLPAEALEVVGDELWMGYGNAARKVEADPTTEVNWVGGFRIGNSTTDILWMKQTHNELFFFKEDGVYTLSKEGEDQELFPGLRMARSTENGKQTVAWLDALFVPQRDGFYKITPDGAITPIGTEHLLDNASEVRGRIAAFAGHNTWFGYAIQYNEDLDHTYLLKYGSWIEEGGESGVMSQAIVYHGALAKWRGKKGICAEIVAAFPTSTDNDRLYVGFDDGTVEWLLLPTLSPNPSQDGTVQFTTLDAEVYLPAHHGGFQADVKEYRGFSIFGSELEPDNYVEVWYTTDAVSAAADKYTVMRTLESADTVEDSGTDGVTTTGNVFTSATAAFVSGHVGQVISINGYEKVVRTVTSGTAITYSGAEITAGTGLAWNLLSSEAAQFTQNGQRVNFATDRNIYGKVIYLKVALVNASSSTTPVLEGMAIHEAVNPDLVLAFGLDVKAHNNVAKRDGSTARRRAETIYAALKEAVERPGLVECWLPTGDSEFLSFIEFDPKLKATHRRSGIEWDIGIKAVQYRTQTSENLEDGENVPYFNLVGLSYATLELYTYGELERQVL
jgi:hypothetical protein